MGIRIPKHPPLPPQKRKLSYSQVGARWRVPGTIAKFELERAGVPATLVEQPPRRGVLLSDLLEFEERVRSGAIKPFNLSRTPTLEVVK
jgi:hypothetical protein